MKISRHVRCYLKVPVCEPNLPSMQKISLRKLGKGKLCPLKLEVQGRLVSSKTDVAMCRDQSILGVNLQFISDGEIQLRTFAMKELKRITLIFYFKTVFDEVIGFFVESPRL